MDLVRSRKGCRVATVVFQVFLLVRILTGIQPLSSVVYLEVDQQYKNRKLDGSSEARMG